jgi:predicted nucleic acid-binding protein
MNADVFVDTNVLLYAVSGAPAEEEKASRARRILASEDFGLSSQVLQEFFVNATRKIAVPLTDQEALRFIEVVSVAPVVPVDLDLVIEAVALKKRFGVSYWDAAILAAAHELGARTLYTEDLNPGQRYGEILAVNPFAVGAAR